MKWLPRLTANIILASSLTLLSGPVHGQTLPSAAREHSQFRIKMALGEKFNKYRQDYYKSPTLAGLDQMLSCGEEYLAVSSLDINSVTGDIYVTAEIASALGDGIGLRACFRRSRPALVASGYELPTLPERPHRPRMAVYQTSHPAR